MVSVVFSCFFFLDKVEHLIQFALHANPLYIWQHFNRRIIRFVVFILSIFQPNFAHLKCSAPNIYSFFLWKLFNGLRKTALSSRYSRFNTLCYIDALGRGTNYGFFPSIERLYERMKKKTMWNRIWNFSYSIIFLNSQNLDTHRERHFR